MLPFSTKFAATATDEPASAEIMDLANDWCNSESTIKSQSLAARVVHHMQRCSNCRSFSDYRCEYFIENSSIFEYCLLQAYSINKDYSVQFLS